MDKFLEALALIGVGAAVYLTIEHSPTIKKAVSNIVPISTIPTDIVPVSTRPPRDDRPPPPRGTCPPGYSPDYTLGIFRCHDPHGTRELNPNVKLISPQWANAWGSDQCINCTTPGQPGIPGTPGAPGIPGQPGRCYENGVQIPCDNYFYDDAFAEPNMTQPLVQPDINKQIESQIKKQHEKEVKHQKKPDQEKKVHTQIECPSDLSKLKCGSNCYKDGKLYKVTCSEEERKALFPPKKKRPSITIPANFPSDVTISPGTDEEPYPTDTDTTGVTDTTPGGDVPLTDLPGGQQPIVPTIPPGTPGQAPTPSAPAPPLFLPTGPGQAVGHSSPGGCNHKDPWDSCRFAIGCTCDGKKSSEDGGQDGVKVSDLIGNSSSFYAIWTFHAPQGFTTDKVNGAEVTGAYCGSNDKYPTVGITIGVHANGQIKTRTEDHLKVGGKQRAPGDYMDLNNGVGIKNVPGFNKSVKDFTIIWCADKTGNDVIYRGYLKIGNGKEIKIANIRNPPEGGSGFASHRDSSRTKVIDFTKQQNWYMRGRIDSAGLHATASGTLYKGHYNPSSSGFSYSGPEGYMLEGDGYF